MDPEKNFNVQFPFLHFSNKRFFLNLEESLPYLLSQPLPDVEALD